MAEIEEIEHGDEGRVREWTARALRAAPDPQWSADGVVSDRWMPVSPATGRLDAFQWKLPVAEIGIERPVIEVEPAPRESTEIAVETPKPASARAEPPPTKAPPRPKPVPPVEAVIPLVHVPDDPGPDQQLEADPVPEPTTPSGGWRRLFR